MILTEKTIAGRRTEVKLFDDLCDMADAVGQAPWRNTRHVADMVGPDYGGAWLGRSDLNSMADALRSMGETWSEGLATFDRMRGELGAAELPAPVNRRRRARFSDVDGDELDLDRLRSGQDYWRTTRREHSPGPATITVIVEIGATGGVHARDILWRGAAAVALCDILEESGRSVELWGVTNSKHSYTDGADTLIGCQIKAAGETLDTSALVNVTSGWALRSVWFAARGLSERSLRESLGRRVSPPDEAYDEITDDAERLIIRDAYDYSEALDQVRKCLQQLEAITA